MTLEQLTQRKIAELADRYSRDGYAVTIEPDPNTLPPFLRDFRVDIVAASGDGNVIIEVKPWSSENTDLIARLAGAIEGHADWRLEVAFVNQPTDPEVPAHGELASDQHAESLLQRAASIFARGDVDAAAMLAWSAIEILLRRIAHNVAPEIERRNSAKLLKHLYALGHIRPETYDMLHDLMDYRNSVAHGFVPNSSPPVLTDLLSSAHDLRAVRPFAA